MNKKKYKDLLKYFYYFIICIFFLVLPMQVFSGSRGSEAEARTANYLNISQYWRETLDDYEYGPYFIFYDIELMKLFYFMRDEILTSGKKLYEKERLKERKRNLKNIRKMEKLSKIENILRRDKK